MIRIRTWKSPLAHAVLPSIAIQLLLVLCHPSWTSADDSNFQYLFDGASLSDWRYDPQYWRVEEGAIVGEIPSGTRLSHNTWLVWSGGELQDFDLRLQFKLTGAPAANSGIQVRCQVRDIDHVSGYQADLDMGAQWLGRIYDEHGRALLVERGQRVRIDPNGQRVTQSFAPANMFRAVFRENEWNDYRIVGIGNRIAVFINGTLFSELIDREADARDLSGSLAMQLHSGPETRIAFRNIKLEQLQSDDDRLGKWIDEPETAPETEPFGIHPTNKAGETLELSFESGDLTNWSATGDAFSGQPVAEDTIGNRWSGQVSNKQGRYFIGGYERTHSDREQGTLTSSWFLASHPYASFLIGGGRSEATRVDVLRRIERDGDVREELIATASGQNREQMRRVVIDLNRYQGQDIAVRLVDASSGGWGHLNFDDFRFHKVRPTVSEPQTNPLYHPLLHGLQPNPASASAAKETLEQMFVPPGFSVDLIASEPRLHQPMAFTFDAKGRLWVVEGHSYPTKRAKGEGLDKVLIFEDADRDGSFESTKVFYEGLNLVSGLQVGHGGVWIGAAPQLLFIPDRDLDDVPDSAPEILLDGFGFADTHETLNSFTWGPDGWLYGNQGVFNQSRVGKPGCSDEERQYLAAGVWRYHPIRHKFEVFASGGSNQWGLDFDLYGQLFMTHCRSRWGGGPTTHVIQGGHYWNQVNAQYAAFISANPVAGKAYMRNYLLASARYGHGEGGAGKRGSRALYGGHSHVGTMIYLGDNWPPQFRNHLFTHNLHGHRINHQVNHRESGGFHTVHAGYDVFLCTDPQYIGVDLQYGPDGAVYFSDWYDPRHCHNPNSELWQRGNGRMYRMQFGDHKPAVVNYHQSTDAELVDAQLSKNDWHVRASRLVLAERVASGKAIDNRAINGLRAMATQHPDADRRLRALWCLHVMKEFDAKLAQASLADRDEYVRGWTIQLMSEGENFPGRDELLLSCVSSESSPLVKLYLISASMRVSSGIAWQILETLASQAESASERNLPRLLWQAIAKRVPENLPRATSLLESAELQELKTALWWYLPQVNDEAREILFRKLRAISPAEQAKVLPLVASGLSATRNLTAPESWSEMAEELYLREDTNSFAETIGAAFNDPSLMDRMRSQLSQEDGSLESKLHALRVLDHNSDSENLDYLLPQLRVPQLQMSVIRQLQRYASPEVADALIARLVEFGDRERQAALETICSRPASALALMDAIDKHRVKADVITGYFARQMASLNSQELNRRLEATWGRLTKTSAEKRKEIRTLVDAFETAPLWAYDIAAGARHFQKLCAACHLDSQDTPRIGPRLEGSGAKGIEYIVENIIDPNAVIGEDFLARNILTVDASVITGVVTNENDSAITVRTATGATVVAQDDVERIVVSPNSFMPAGLLQSLTERERIELLKYLISLK